MARRSSVRIPRPDRLRRLAGTPFGWADARLLRHGWLRALRPEATAVYAFLCLAADRQGVSYYRRERIARELGLDEALLDRALARLGELGLTAYAPFQPGAADGFHQVLALPEGQAPRSLPGGLEALVEDVARSLPSSPGRRPAP